MFKPASTIPWFAALAMMMLGPLPRGLAQEGIKPPFGLAWGQMQSEVTSLLSMSNARITSKRIIDDREAWTISGLQQPGLKCAVFYFQKSGLIEVELQYENSGWTATRYQLFLSQVRKNIEEKYGLGTLIARSQGPNGSVTETVVGYQWTQSGAMLQLFYYAAETQALAYRTVSLHYKMN